MSQRLDDFNKKFVYTNTNPENIIAAKKNAMFFRNGKEFYFNPDGNLDGAWIKLPYNTVIIPPPPLTKLIQYQHPYEVWVKTTDGNYDQYKQILPKTGWKFVSYTNIFNQVSSLKKLNWIFPPPSSTSDSIGNNNSRSYDENYFYAKVGGKWYRTPIATFDFAGGVSNDNPALNTNLPFIDNPRVTPVPNIPVYPGEEGDQSYDADFFYIKPSNWKRSTLLVYSGLNKMTVF